MCKGGLVVSVEEAITDGKFLNRDYDPAGWGESAKGCLQGMILFEYDYYLV